MGYGTATNLTIEAKPLDSQTALRALVKQLRASAAGWLVHMEGGAGFGGRRAGVWVVHGERFRREERGERRGEESRREERGGEEQGERRREERREQREEGSREAGAARGR